MPLSKERLEYFIKAIQDGDGSTWKYDDEPIRTLLTQAIAEAEAQVEAVSLKEYEHLSGLLRAAWADGRISREPK